MPLWSEEFYQALRGNDPYQRAGVLPVARDAQGNATLAMPQLGMDFIRALMLPGDVYTGKTQMFDPETGHVGDDVIKRSADLAGSMTLGAGAIPAEANSLRMGMKIRNHKGETIEAPRQFYRGTNPGDKRRISTGTPEWDSHLFVSSDIEEAKMYGRHIDQYEAAPDARILYEGTKDWQKIAGKPRKDENMLQYANRAAKAAKDAGYDAAWFKMQGNIGTAVINPGKFKKLGD